MYIAVTPLIHSIRGKDRFTYTSDLPLVLGQLVWVPWRTQTKLGIVVAVDGVEPLDRAKPLAGSTDIVLPEQYRQFLSWFSQYYAISLSHAYTYALPNLTPRTLIQAYLSSQAIDKAVLNRPIRKRTKAKAETHLVQNQLQMNEFIRQAVIEGTGPVIVLAPEINAVKTMQDSLADLQPICITSDTPQPQLRQAFFQLLVGHDGLYIGTKRLSLLPLLRAAHIIVVEPEDFSHKQWALNPRYHVYRLTEYLLEQGQAVTYLSYCPRVEQYASHPIRVDLISIGSSTVTDQQPHLIDMTGQYQLSLQVQDRLAAAKTAVVWYQHKGMASLLACSNCSTIVHNVKALTCPNCASPTLRIRGYGTSDLVQKIRQILPNRRVIEITQGYQSEKIDYSTHPIIVGTSALKSALDWTQVDYTAVISVDYVLGLGHFRAHEITLQQLQWLKYHSRRLDIQSYVPDHPVFAAVHQDWPEDWFAQTLQDRQQLHYPPTTDRIEIRHIKTQQRRVIHNLSELPDDPSWIIDREI